MLGLPTGDDVRGVRGEVSLSGLSVVRPGPSGTVVEFSFIGESPPHPPQGLLGHGVIAVDGEGDGGQLLAARQTLESTRDAQYVKCVLPRNQQELREFG